MCTSYMHVKLLLSHRDPFWNIERQHGHHDLPVCVVRLRDT